MNHPLRALVFTLLVRPAVLVGLGLNVRHRERLPRRGPAIVVSNHNSHLDTLVLLTLFPRRALKTLRPVAAADYFLRNRWLAWFALNVVGILPLERRARASAGDPLAALDAALARGETLILFPEGTRGEPERMSELRTGVAHLAKRHPDVPIVPVFLHGLGKALPKGEWLPVPFFCDVGVGEPLHWSGERAEFMERLRASMSALAGEVHAPPWE